MAICVAELARAGLTPDWVPGAVRRYVPTIVKQYQHGTHASAVVVGSERIRVRGPGTRATWKTVDILACPITFSQHPQQIEAARRGYDDWWQALDRIREGRIAGEMLRRGRGDGGDAEGAAVDGKALILPAARKNLSKL